MNIPLKIPERLLTETNNNISPRFKKLPSLDNLSEQSNDQTVTNFNNIETDISKKKNSDQDLNRQKKEIINFNKNIHIKSSEKKIGQIDESLIINKMIKNNFMKVNNYSLSANKKNEEKLNYINLNKNSLQFGEKIDNISDEIQINKINNQRNRSIRSTVDAIDEKIMQRQISVKIESDYTLNSSNKYENSKKSFKNNDFNFMVSTKNTTSSLYKSNSEKTLITKKSNLGNSIISNTDLKNAMINNNIEEFVYFGKALKIDCPEELHFFYVEIRKLQKNIICKFDK